MKKIKKLALKSEIIRHTALRGVYGGIATGTGSVATCVDEMCTTGGTTGGGGGTVTCITCDERRCQYWPIP